MRYLLSMGVLLAFSLPANGSTAAAVANILNDKQAPDGVLFEIVDGDRKFLDWAIPEVKKYTEKLRSKFPGLSIAVVTHGREQFALMKNKQKKNQSLHKKVKSLVEDNNISLHVCGTHASWFDIAEEDFPDFVDVASAAPAQINDYEALGFIVIMVEK